MYPLPSLLLCSTSSRLSFISYLSRHSFFSLSLCFSSPPHPLFLRSIHPLYTILRRPFPIPTSALSIFTSCHFFSPLSSHIFLASIFITLYLALDHPSPPFDLSLHSPRLLEPIRPHRPSLTPPLMHHAPLPFPWHRALYHHLIY